VHLFHPAAAADDEAALRDPAGAERLVTVATAVTGALCAT
jgi:hypothetical protein